MNPAQERSYGVLGSEVWKDQLRSKMNVDYYGVMAVWRRFWGIFFNVIALVASSSAAVLFIQASDESKWIAAALAMVAAVASVVNALSPWAREQARFLHSQEEHRKQEVRWEVLWHRLYAHEYQSLHELWDQYEEFKRLDAEAEQVAQPHRQRPWLVKRIQKRLKRTEVNTGGDSGRQFKERNQRARSPA